MSKISPMRWLAVALTTALALGAAALLLVVTRPPVVWAGGVFSYPGGAPCDTTLQACIDGLATGDTINVAPGIYTESVTLNKSVSLVGAGPNATWLVALPNSRVLTVTGVVTHGAVISGLTFTGGNLGATGCGGVLVVAPANPVMTSLVISNNVAQWGAGMCTGGAVALSNILFLSNTATTFGGGGLDNGGILTLTQVTFQSNRAPFGGGLYNDGPATLYEVDFFSNTSTSFAGGGIDNDSVLSMTRGLFQGNQSNSNGGALYTDYSTQVTMTAMSFVSNTAPNSGGGMLNYGQTSMQDTTFWGNSATVNGGGILNGGKLYLEAVTLVGNSASTGGGIANYNGKAYLYANNSTFSGNEAEYGGGLVNSAATAFLTEVTFSENTASSGGGALYHYSTSPSSNITVTRSLVADSLAGGNCFVDNTSLVDLASIDYNLSDDASCADFFTQPNDQNEAEPALGPLQDNGGATWTHLPGLDGDGIDMAGNACSATDQRGQPRPAGAACDIGAVERQESDGVSFELYLPLVIR
jgi:predicted outer membrane repeat protein